MEALVKLTKSRKQSKYPSLTDEPIKKMWDTHTMKHNLAFKKEGNPLFETAWMKLEDII
jgi:hypothetical protein